jgi:hypothetical protein
MLEEYAAAGESFTYSDIKNIGNRKVVPLMRRVTVGDAQ